MEILNSGSFVPLDNREKIDQLIYTARELATEVGRTEGFQNSGQTNHQLGLEMWKGAEYVCRAHEEANIRNLFLSKFLERLREIEKETSFQAKAVVSTMAPAAAVPVRPPEPASVLVPPQPQPPVTRTLPEQPLQNAAQDDYLGVVAADEQAENNRPSYADECVPEYDADIEALVDRLDNEDVDGSSKPAVTEFAQPEIAALVYEPANETATDHPVTFDQSDSKDVAAEEIQPADTESVESRSISSIVISEKEPYNFDGCTVTAVVQLLPESEGVRKCVVSVRTHDFAPRIAIVDVAMADALPLISATLGLAFEQYRTELPARAAEKMKKEKPAAKKQFKAGSKAAKAATIQPKAATSSETTAAAPALNPETDQSQQGLFAS